MMLLRDTDTRGNYVVGANIAGFEKVAECYDWLRESANFDLES